MSSEYDLISKAIKKLKSEMKEEGHYILAKEKIRKALNELKNDNTTLALEYLKDALILVDEENKILNKINELKSKNPVIIKNYEVLLINTLKDGNLKKAEELIKEIDSQKIPAEFTPKPTTPKTFPPELEEFYKNIQFIGQGGFARVFKAIRVKDNLPVAIKLPISLDASTGKSFIKELENWTKLNHPNIVKVYDYNILPIPYFEMELCDESLEDYLKRKRVLDVKEASYIIFNIAEGLKYAHNKGIIHRDLKPHNILLKNGIPKITDWGLSKVIAKSTSTTKYAFTPYYASPEQFSKKFGNIGFWTDIWQLGVIFYQLTTGKLPFEGDDFVELMTIITTEKPIKPSELNPNINNEIENIILKCLSKNPKDRYSSILELQRDLAKYLQITFKEELKKSITIRDFSRSAFYCGELFLMCLKINDGVNAYKYCGDLIEYAKGEIKNDLIKLKEMIKYRIENKMPIPEEIISSAEVIVHKIKLKFERD
ncbi:serine/threonine protein kinase [Methanocaldococcus vulcanius M7]|uniref:Serine/threonine protein kinase n=1 Tax=Methanocaldococcus vulcanius (strain ATCC 700851 / DSM 12094 / M7) TaxID=579137 RepID=C9RGZ6_METVM|nr:serine/threonine-protein kinase [Methanocaldococcus vulcanius]ACX72848.1 serine/threonine protein kinase [Methanocaldococcus vulcanius M7]